MCRISQDYSGLFFFGCDDMNKLISSKYILLVLAAALFIGNQLSSLGYVNGSILIPVFLLLCLLLFINRSNKSLCMAIILAMVVLFSALEYQIAASKTSYLSPLAGKKAVVEGIVAAEPMETEYGYKVLLKEVYLKKKDKTFKCNEKLQIYISNEEKLDFGDYIRVTAELQPIAKFNNFGDFDFKKYYKSKNINMKANVDRVTVLSNNKGGYVATLLHRCNQELKNTIFSALPKREAALLYGILTGSKSDMEQEVLEVFALTGLAHILSVSGLHIGFLVLMLANVLKPLKLSKQVHGILIFCIVLFYILLIGAPVPAVRALLMLAVMLGGSILGKKYELIASASFAAIILLLYNPLLIHDPSFVISFACIYSICFLHQPITHRLQFLPSWLRNSLALSIAVWLGITPVLVHYFNYVSVINILLNVIAVPLAFLITAAGFAAVLLGMLLPAVGLFVFAASYYLIRLLYFISEKALLIPFVGLDIPALPLYFYFIYYLFPLMLIEDFWKYRSLNFKRKYMAAGILALSLAVLIYILPYPIMRLYFINVGQGDCSVIQTPNRKIIVVDGGGSSDWQRDTYDIGKKVTVPALRQIGIWRVDTVIVSHIHDDHMGGVLSIVEEFKVRQVILPASDKYGEGEFKSDSLESLKALCKEKKIPMLYLKSGSIISAGNDIKLAVIAPEQPYHQNTDSDVNNNSLVFKLSYKDFDALYTGDIQQEAEQRLIKKEISCDVLKVAHHGSPYSSMAEFLEQADPEFSILSVGKNNYGHPSTDVIERLTAKESKVYRTDLSGAIMLTTDGRKLKIRTVRQ